MCRTQWLTGFGEPYGLNHVAIHITAQALDVCVDRVFLEKLRYFEDHALQIVGTRRSASSKQTQRCDPAQRERCAVEFGDHLKWACDNCKL